MLYFQYYFSNKSNECVDDTSIFYFLIRIHDFRKLLISLNLCASGWCQSDQIHATHFPCVSHISISISFSWSVCARVLFRRFSSTFCGEKKPKKKFFWRKNKCALAVSLISKRHASATLCIRLNILKMHYCTIHALIYCPVCINLLQITRISHVASRKQRMQRSSNNNNSALTRPPSGIAYHWRK